MVLRNILGEINYSVPSRLLRVEETLTSCLKFLEMRWPEKSTEVHPVFVNKESLKKTGSGTALQKIYTECRTFQTLVIFLARYCQRLRRQTVPWSRFLGTRKAR